MRLLVITHEFPPIGGGGATACKYIVEHMSHLYDRTEVITSGFRGLRESEEKDNYVIKRIFSFRKKIHSGRITEVLFFIVHGIQFLIKEMRYNKPDVVFAFFTLPAGFLSWFLNKVYKIRYIVFLRGIDVPGFYGGRFSFLNRLLSPIIKKIWINADKIIANSQSLQQLAYKTCRIREIDVIPNGVDISFYKPLRERGIANKVKAIFVGRLNKQKGLDMLLDSVAIITKETLNSFVLEVVGDGPDKNSLLRRSKALNIADRVIFSGWMDRDSLLKKYQDADIFVTTSLDEGMPNTLLEAMACGLPILASDILPHRELIENGKNGLLFSMQGPKALADAIGLLIKDKALRDSMGNENLKRIKKYSLDNIYNYLEILKIQ